MNRLLDKFASRQAILMTLGATALALLLLIAAPVVLAFQSQREDLNESEAQLAAYQAKVADEPAIAARLKEALSRTSAAPGLFRSENISIAQAEVESDFKSIAAQSGADIRSTQILPVTQTSGFDVIAIEYDLTVPESRLRDLAYSIETHEPYLFIGDLSITAPENLPEGDASAKDPPLELRWTVRGYRLGGAQ